MDNMIIFLFYILLFSFISIYTVTACHKCVHQSRASYFSPSYASSDACGYGSMPVNFTGYYEATGSSTLYRDGVGCGACFQIRCKHSRICNSDGVKVVLTDLHKARNKIDFLMNGQGFKALAKNGMANEVNRLAIVDVEYKRIPCEYKNKNILVRVMEKSKKPNHLTIKFLYQGGQTDILAVDVAQVGSLDWRFMRRENGEVWNTDRVPTGPLQLRMVVTSGFGGRWVWTEKEVLPLQWKVGSVYDLGVQLNDIAHDS